MVPDEPSDPPAPPEDGTGPDETPAEDAGAAEPRGPGGGLDERLGDMRAGELLAKRPDELQEELDPETIAQLARWFGLPSFTELAEQEAESAQDAAWREKREKIEAAADPALMAHLGELSRVGDGLRQITGSVAVHVEAPIECLDPTFSERFGAVADAREIEIPWEIEDELKQCTPQAILRDLHRPEENFFAQMELQEPPAMPPSDAMREIREIMTTSFHFAPPASTSARIRTAQEDLRWMRGTDWGALAVGKGS